MRHIHLTKGLLQAHSERNKSSSEREKLNWRKKSRPEGREEKSTLEGNTAVSCWLYELGPGVLSQKQPSNACLWLRLLGCFFVDIGIRWNSVHLAVKFFPAWTPENLSAKCTSYNFISSLGSWPESNFMLASSPYAQLDQLGFRPTWDTVSKLSSLLNKHFQNVKVIFLI